MVFGSRGLDFEDPEPLVTKSYDLPNLPWDKIAGRLEQVAISVLHLDARLEASGLSAGWQSRCDMTGRRQGAHRSSWIAARCRVALRLKTDHAPFGDGVL
jgi:hypothetical protein